MDEFFNGEICFEKSDEHMFNEPSFDEQNLNEITEQDEYDFEQIEQIIADFKTTLQAVHAIKVHNSLYYVLEVQNPLTPIKEIIIDIIEQIVYGEGEYNIGNKQIFFVFDGNARCIGARYQQQEKVESQFGCKYSIQNEFDIFDYVDEQTRKEVSKLFTMIVGV